MAIEIEQRTEVNKLVWPIAFLVFSLAAAATLLVSYFYFSNSYNESLLVLGEKQKRLSLTEDEKALEDSLIRYQNKIQMFGEVFKDHKKAGSLLSFVEKTCHPGVYYSKISYDLKTGDLSLEGLANDFMIVSQQVIIFKQQKDAVSKVLLDNLSPKEDGGISFSLKINVDPDITLISKQ